jgi:hypothetical protein
MELCLKLQNLLDIQYFPLQFCYFRTGIPEAFIFVHLWNPISALTS